MEIQTKDDLKKLWVDFFHHLYETSTYCELLYAPLLASSKKHIGEKTAKHNYEIIKKYNYFFNSVERGISYALVLSVTQMFEDGNDKRKRTLAYLLDEARKFKINKWHNYESLQVRHKETLENLKSARDQYFAHRQKNLNVKSIPSANKMYALLNDIADLLNYIGQEFENGGETYLWHKNEAGWSKKVQGDFQRILDNLHRGEATRKAEIEVKYSRKLYTEQSYKKQT